MYLVRAPKMRVKNSEIITEIAKCYFLSKKQCSLMSFSSGKVDPFNLYYKYYKDVEAAFALLSDDEKLVINNDYFYNDYYGWWKSIFSKSEYRLLKRRAEKDFLSYFYATH